MSLTRFVIRLCLYLAVLASPATAQQPDAPTQRQPSSEAGIFSLIPDDSVTEHRLETPDGPLAYTATAGTLDLYGQDGNRTAKVFYTAYVAGERDPERPITFVFNGGPGAASAYLHLGLVGPRVLEFGESRDDGTRPSLKDNPDSWLPFTDLVLIDPVGTGWSRAASDDAAGRFYGVQQDAESLAKVIALYTQKNGRLSSPAYLLGESYGGFRAAKVASALKETQGILVSGILMVSPLVEGRLIFGGASNDPVSAALQLPALAAAEMERRDAFDIGKLREAEHFAMTDYLVTLAGPSPAGPEADAFYQRVADLTGIAKDEVAKARGFVGGLYARLSEDSGRVASPYDAAYTVPDAYPESTMNRNDDPILDGFTRAYGAAFAAYAHDELGFRTGMTYSLLNTAVNRRWQWNDGRGGEGRANASASGNLRDLLSTIPRFRVAIYHGYSDVLTPYGASRYVLDHLPPALSEGRTELAIFRGGHMFYVDPASRRQMTEDVRRFYSALAGQGHPSRS
ncbi:carboxypeptidase [Rhizobiaceae bacterium BDR2-2]|uniref:Carboxypeptidase n=1 Tax=Ectorhizobium quercum TaxID=2965071 RepID=A0AAE3SVQ6_9HYPH|nr:carboxypeptidase [Ectorhizobium quercum]MCX8997913.1 carboxypeptidase [Ectorhizobium quercum]